MPPSTLSPTDDSLSHTRETTPELTHLPVNCDTPSAPRFSEDVDFRSLFVKPQRQLLIEYLGGEARCETTGYFFKNILPPVWKQLSVNRIFKRCLESGVLIERDCPETTRYSWAGFSNDPEKSSQSESTVFNNPLENLFNSIVKAAFETSSKGTDCPRQTTYMNADGDNPTWSEMKSYPDTLNGRHWYSSALSLHFKKSEKGSYENAQQMIHSLHHSMSIDSCRRFTLGATIENVSIKLWIYNRSNIIACKPFNFNAEPKTFIHFIISIAFAKRSDLGWDPTVTVKYDSKRLFDFEIAGKHYTSNSTKILEDLKANGIYTTGTRIFEALCSEETGEKKSVIIKDYWPADTHDSEDIIQQKILTCITEGEEKNVSERLKVDGKEDHTKKTILHGKPPRAAFKLNLPNEEIGVKNKPNASQTVSYLNSCAETRSQLKKLRNNQGRECIYRFHYRIVYEEVAIPYYKLRNLKDMMLVLEHSIKALRIIHKEGWVHRDLSPGNLYLYTDPITTLKRGIIGDFEFAKRVGTERRNDVRTVSADFMAVEIAHQGYIVKPARFAGLLQTKTKAFKDKLPKSDQDKNNNIVWANYMHDLESIWWIAVWTFLNFEKDPGDDLSCSRSSPKAKDQIRVFKRKEASDNLFPRKMDYMERWKFFTEDIVFQNTMNDLPCSLPVLYDIINTFRYHLGSTYIREEENSKCMDLPIQLLDGGVLHREIINILPNEDIKLIAVKDAPVIIDETHFDFNQALNDARIYERKIEKTRLAIQLRSNRRVTRSMKKASSTPDGDRYTNTPRKRCFQQQILTSEPQHKRARKKY